MGQRLQSYILKALKGSDVCSAGNLRTEMDPVCAFEGGGFRVRWRERCVARKMSKK